MLLLPMRFPRKLYEPSVQKQMTKSEEERFTGIRRRKKKWKCRNKVKNLNRSVRRMNKSLTSSINTVHSGLNISNLRPSLFILGKVLISP